MEIKNLKEYMFELMVRKFMDFGIRDQYLLKESFKSTQEPGFKEKENEYIFSEPVQKEYDKLSDSQKVESINFIDKILQAGETDTLYTSPPNMVNQMAANAVGALYRDSNLSRRTRIKDFLITYYNPQPEEHLEKRFFSPNASFQKVLPATIEINYWRKKNILPDFIDMVENSYFDAMDHLLNKGGFKPENGLFDAFLFQISWRRRLLQQIIDWNRRHGITKTKDVEDGEHAQSSIRATKQVGTTEIGDKEEYEELISQHDIEPADSPFGSLEVPAEQGVESYEQEIRDKKANDRIIKYMMSKLKGSRARDLKIWYDFYKQKFGASGAQAKQAIVDIVGSPDLKSLDKIAPEGQSPQVTEFYDYFEQQLGISNENARKRMFELKQKLAELIKDPTFIRVLGLADIMNIKKLNPKEFLQGAILKASKGEKKQKIKKDSSKKDADEPSPGEGGGLSEARLLRFLTFSEICVNENLKKHKNKLNKINEVKSQISIMSEGYEVDTISLDEQIYKYLNIVKEDLEESLNLLNELYRIHSEIELEYGEVSEKLKELIPPLESKVRDVVNEVKKAKNLIAPYLSGLFETDLKKKQLNPDELEEERLTNPETKKFVRQRQNFIGSHIYGEDLGGLEKMYVAYSYGEQFPAYLWFKNKWYHNTDKYVLDDGSINEPTEQHKADMRPVQDTHGLSTLAMNTMIRKFKNKYGIGDNVHRDVEPGEKN